MDVFENDHVHDALTWRMMIENYESDEILLSNIIIKLYYYKYYFKTWVRRTHILSSNAQSKFLFQQNNKKY